MTMTVDEAADHIRELLRDAGLNATRPDPAIVWNVFKRFAAVPVDSAGGPACEELWFESSDGDPKTGSPSFFDFVRQFLQDTEGGAEFHEQITAHFTCEPGVRLGLQRWIAQAGDVSDLPAWFKTVEASPAFKIGSKFLGWSFEVRIDAC